MKIGVYGSSEGEMTQELKEKIRKIGAAIAKLGATLVTGACPGIPYEAAIGAKELKGKCIGFSPTVDLEAHQKLGYPTEGFSELFFIPKDYPYAKDPDIGRKYRNISSVAYIDAAIMIGGRIGSMNEFTIAYDTGKVIGVLEGTGGITKRAIKVLLEDAAKKTKAEVIFESDPERLVEMIYKKLT